MQVLFDVVGLEVYEVDGIEDEEAGGVRRQTADDELFAAGDAGALGAVSGVSKKATTISFCKKAMTIWFCKKATTIWFCVVLPTF